MNFGCVSHSPTSLTPSQMREIKKRITVRSLRSLFMHRNLLNTDTALKTEKVAAVRGSRSAASIAEINYDNQSKVA